MSESHMSEAHMETENISGCEEHQELCILSLRHGQFIVFSALLPTRFVNLQAIEKKIYT